MKGDCVAIGITGNEEAPEGTVGKRAEARAAPLDDQVVQRASVVARDPEHHAHTERPRFEKRTERLSQRQRDRRGLENGRAGRTLRGGFETEDLHVELTGCGEAAHLQGNEVGTDWRCHVTFCRNLERGGLIVRRPHPEHGRVIMTELTKAGQKAVAEGAKAADVVERQMLSMLSAEEAKLLSELLKRCAAALDDEPSDS